MRGRSFACTGLLLAALSVPGRAQEACPGRLDEARGFRVAVVDAHGGLRDGRGGELVLAGISLPDDQRAELAQRLAGKALLVFPRSREPQDRWGRLVAHAAEQDESGAWRWLQERLISQGLALADATIAERCLHLLLGFEEQPRKERLGLWAKDDYVLQATRVNDLARRIGENVLVEGRVVRARALGDRAYVDFARAPQAGLALVVRRRDWAAFGIEPAAAELGLRGRTVRVRGHLEWRNGPQIEATGPASVEWLTQVRRGR